MTRWPWVSREFLSSAEARARSEHDNAQQLRRDLAAAESRADQERAERIADREKADRQLAIWKNGTEVLERSLVESRAAESAATLNAQKLTEILNREAAAYERDMVRSEARYAELLAKFTALRMEGAQSPPPSLPYVEREPMSEGDKEINKVIREQAGDNYTLAKDMRKTVREMKADGKTSDEIVGALVSVWSSENVG